VRLNKPVDPFPDVPRALLPAPPRDVHRHRRHTPGAPGSPNRRQRNTHRTRLALPMAPSLPVRWWNISALIARLPTGRAPRSTSSRRKSRLGGSRRWGPLGALDEAAEDSAMLLRRALAAFEFPCREWYRGPLPCYPP
jgi:hypothetical protein